jgi:selenide,water dikinase
MGPFIRSMTTLNDRASQVMQSFEVHACTDVTGFGLLGHMKEMLAGDPREVRLMAREIPLLPGALEYAEAGLIPGGMYRNSDFVGSLCALAPSVPRALADILFDPQTSGGLLIAVPGHDASSLLSALRNAGVADARLIAEVVKSGTASMKVE